MTGPTAGWRTAPGRGGTGGFTLIELMIVIAIIAIIAAIAVPNLLAARMRANESAAIAVLRNVATAQSQFRQVGRADEDRDSNGEYGYFGELTGVVAVRGSSDYSSQLTGSMSRVDTNGEVQRNGYIFRFYIPDATGVGVREKSGGGQDAGLVDPDQAENIWLLYAWPAKYDSTGTRTFFMSQRGDLLWSEVSAYEKSNCPLEPGAAIVTSDPQICTGLPAVGVTGGDGNLWKAVQ